MPITPAREESPEITSKVVLLIEGDDEVNFFKALFQYMGLIPGIDIQPRLVGGKDNFRNEFPAFLNDPNFPFVTAYAIIRDADTNATNTLKSVQKLLRENKQPCPTGHARFAQDRDNKLKVGVFIMPGNPTGMLEDLCLRSVKNHPIMPHVEDYMNRVIETMQENAPKNQSKAKVQAFLSGMNKTVPRLGVAAVCNYWPFDNEAFCELRHFIEQLVLQ